MSPPVEWDDVQGGLEFPSLEVPEECLDMALLGWVTGWTPQSRRPLPAIPQDSVELKATSQAAAGAELPQHTPG